jgi:hypothetical protein
LIVVEEWLIKGKPLPHTIAYLSLTDEPLVGSDMFMMNFFKHDKNLEIFFTLFSDPMKLRIAAG